MAAPAVMPCGGWVPIYTDSVAVSGYDAALLASMEDYAERVLWALSGRQFGVCEYTIRPCRRRCLPDRQFSAWGSASTTPAGMWPAWWWLPTCSCTGDTCSCPPICEIDLGPRIVEVTSVVVDGVAFSAYDAGGAQQWRVDDWRKLVRVDGSCWPECQDLNLDADQPGTWAVTLRKGRTLPVAGQLALGALAVELVQGGPRG